MINTIRSMAPSTLNQHRSVAALHHVPTKFPFVLFDDVESDDLPKFKSIVARIVVKFPRRHDSQHFILQDITGSKIEAISYCDNVQRFDTLHQQGSTYTLYGVAFYVSWGPYLFRNFGHRLELTLATRTVVEPFHLPIQFPPYPKHLMPFHEVLQQPHKRFIDVIGIVIHLAPLEHIGGRPYREAILMDSRWDIIIVGIWPELLQRNALRWVLARENKSIIIGTMLRRNKLHRCLQTSDHSTVEFDPDHHTTQRLQTIRRSMIQNPRSALINNYLERRRAYLATVVPDV
uniref:Replication protein A OB domain-containing protein n=2 Tax=Zea mays TaxID=4577 RepID=A0A804MP82_MAIZE